MGYIDLFFKVGDSPGDNSLKDGMLICYLHPSMHANDMPYSDHMRKTFCIVRVDESWLPVVKEVINPYTNKAEANDYNAVGPVTKARRAFVNFATLENITGIQNLESDLRSSKVVDVVDGTNITTGIFSDSKNYKGTGIKDNNSVTSGSYTIGSGQQYETCALAYADVDSLSGDLTFIMKTPTTETARADINESVSLEDYNFLHTSDYDHLGDPTRTSRLITLTQDNFGLTPQPTGSGNITLEKLYLNTTATLSNYYHSISVGATAVGTLTIKNILIDKNEKIGSGIVFGSVEMSLRANNIIVWSQGGTSQGCFFFWDVKNNDSYVENCVALNCYRGFSNNIPFNVEFRNCASFNSSSSCFYNIESSIGKNNVSSDSSAADVNWEMGSNNATGKSAADCLISTDDSSSDFCDIKTDGYLVGAGTTTYQTRTTCIRGRTVPGPHGISIGAAEEYGSGPTPGPIGVISQIHRRRRI